MKQHQFNRLSFRELADRENLSANASLSEEATEVEQTQPEAATSDNTEVEKKESSVRRKSASLSRDELMRRLDEVLVRNEPEETVKTHVEAFQNVGIAIKLEESKSLKLDDLSSQSSQSSQESEAMFSEENSEQEEEQELLPCPKKALELDYDKCNILQPLLNPVYIRDIFNFLKSREVNSKALYHVYIAISRLTLRSLLCFRCISASLITFPNNLSSLQKCELLSLIGC